MAVVVFGIVSAGCNSRTTSGSQTPSGVPDPSRVATSAGPQADSSDDRNASGYTVAGEVTSKEEALCAGLTVTVAEVAKSDWPTLLPEFSADWEATTFDECIGLDIADEFGFTMDEALEDAFLYGCANVYFNSNATAGFTEEQAIDFAYSVCVSQYFELAEGWFPDHRILRDGVCYMGFGADATIRGCRDLEGNYVTTTTP